jgi:hypothetical protein
MMNKEKIQKSSRRKRRKKIKTRRKEGGRER